MGTLPTSTATFLFSDIEGSTTLWEKYPGAMQSALARHDSLVRDLAAIHNGHIFKTAGDGFHIAFNSVMDAVQTAVHVQQVMQKETWGETVIKVRIGVHTGEAEFRDGDYFGQTINRVARIMSAGHGGQALLSSITADLIRDQLPQGYSLLDLGEHHLKGLLHAETLYQITAPGLQAEFPPLNSIPTATNNLPAQLTSFIGRERELAEAKKRLEGARLLTMIGPGGTGKTRLSIQLAAEMLPQFPDGVWFVELAPIADPVFILQTVATVLNVRAQMGMPLKEIVSDYLRAKHLLLVFDNCEHLVEASAALADDILHNAPQVKIIASSREALGIAGETVYRVPSLSSPDFRSHQDFGSLMRFESVQLFVERAAAANPKFQLTDENASSVAQICSRLDGIPLALELAASRVSAFTPEQVAKRLDDRFKLLTGGSRTALPRQQTLRALIDWSYDILSPDECKLLKRLSVFAGGWIFEAAESMFSDMDVLELLPQLVNKSLVVMDEEGDEPRYRLLETIRQYARDKLLESGEVEEIRNRHLVYYVNLAEIAEKELFSTIALDWVIRLEAEYDNLRVAFEWGLETDVFSVLRMCGALPYFWFRRGYESEALPLLRTALDRATRQPMGEGDASRVRMRIIANAWKAVSFLAFSQGDVPAASAAARECAALARQLDDIPLLVFVLTFEAESKMMSGSFEEVDSIMEEVLQLGDSSNNAFAQGMAYGLIGTRMVMLGQDDPKAREMLARGLETMKGDKNVFGHSMLLFGIGMAARYNGRFEEARAQFAQLLDIFHDMGDYHRANMINSELAHMDRVEGKFDSAESMYRETIIEWKRLGHRAAVANQLECYAFIAKAQEQPERAVKLLGAAEVLREIININMSQLERVEYDREVADLKANMDEKAFVALWKEGRSMTMEQAIEFALKG